MCPSLNALGKKLVQYGQFANHKIACVRVRTPWTGVLIGILSCCFSENKEEIEGAKMHMYAHATMSY